MLVPPATPFTLQVTLVSLAFVTVAANVCAFPKSTEALEGVTVTPIDGGGGVGGGAADPVPPPTQPCVNPAAAKRKAEITGQSFVSAAAALAHLVSFCVRGRMPCALQAKGQRKSILRVTELCTSTAG